MKNGYTPKSRAEYIEKCRYYKGESVETLPPEVQSMAFYEEWWVDAHYSDDRLELLKDCIAGYKQFMKGEHDYQDGVPIALKALIWSRYMHWGSGGETPETFLHWWKEFYLKGNRK